MWLRKGGSFGIKASIACDINSTRYGISRQAATGHTPAVCPQLKDVQLGRQESYTEAVIRCVNQLKTCTALHVHTSSYCICAQEVPSKFQATVAAGTIDTMYITLRRAISKHSPAVIPPTMTPLVLAAPFGAACQKSHLLQWLLKENGEKMGVPDMVTTMPKRERPEHETNTRSQSHNVNEPEFKVTLKY